MQIPVEYIGREQAFIKHTVLRTYLTRLFMIISAGESVINYIDCFAGPWQDESDELQATSIGISLGEMAKCVDQISKIHGRSITFRALYIEKDPSAFKRLQSFVDIHKKQNNQSIQVDCMHGDYRDLLNDIVTWCGVHFSFFFVDPKGWKRVIGGRTLGPLLSLSKAEFLINFMYDFMNRAANIDKHANDDMEELVGETLNLSPDLKPKQRQNIIISKYRENIKRYYKDGRCVYVPIERHGQDKVLYFLVYLTRHSKGVAVFKEEAEKSLLLQKQVQYQTKLSKQMNQNANGDLFEDEGAQNIVGINELGNHDHATEYLLSVLSSEPLLIDNDCWANFLEETDLLPRVFQMAMLNLVKEGLVENLDANVSRRSKKIIKPDWPAKSERWRLV